MHLSRLGGHLPVHVHLDGPQVACCMQAALERLEEHASAGLSGTALKKATKHVPLLKRATEPALEERLLRRRPAAGQDSIEQPDEPS